MGEAEAPNARAKALTWEGFGPVANNKITASIRPFAGDRITVLIYWVEKEKKKKHRIAEVTGV